MQRFSNRDTESVVALAPNIGLNQSPNTKCITAKNRAKYAIAIAVQIHCFLDLGNHGTAMNQRSKAFGQKTAICSQVGQSEYFATIIAAKELWWS